MYYKYVICILVYRSTNDILECISSIKTHIQHFKIVMVNSHYDDATQSCFAKMAEDHDCDFIDVPNQGYGYGNNQGISYALAHYTFDYLILSNPDIMIQKFGCHTLDKYPDCVIAPLITTLKGKSQNPYWYTKNRLAERLIYQGMKKQNRLLFFGGIGMNKLIREAALFMFRHSGKQEMKIYAAHGSFCLFPYSMFLKTGLPYDEKMFLFGEEAYLSHVLERNRIKTILTKEIQIMHKEDGSVGPAQIEEESELRKSIIYYYEKVHETLTGIL